MRPRSRARSPRPRPRTAFVDLVAQVRQRWAVVVGGGLLGLVVGVIVSGAEAGGGAAGGIAGQAASRTGTAVILLIAVVAGLAIGFLVGLALTSLQPRVTTADDVRRATGLPVVAQLPAAAADVDDLDERAASRRMRTVLREAVMNTRSLAGGELPPRLVVARTDSASDVSGVDGGLARALVESGFVPALVETDFESRLLARPSIVDFGSASGDRSDTAGYQRVAVPDRIAASRPENLLTEVGELLGLLGERYDVTVAQASSTSFPVPLRGIAPAADGVLLVVRSNRTTVEALLTLHAELLGLGVAPLGVVMTGVASRNRVLLRRTWLPSDIREAPTVRAAESDRVIKASASVGGSDSVPEPVVAAAAASVAAPLRAGFSIADLATLTPPPLSSSPDPRKVQP